jgi:2-polyprenyl-6-methoxyphenol hydroxylase-like FAD-dependent oxidoreductase
MTPRRGDNQVLPRHLFSRDDSQDGQVWFGTVVRPLGFRHAEGDDIQAFLLDRFRGWHSPIETLLKETAPKDIIYDDAFALPSSAFQQRFSSSCVTAIGDAAHGVSRGWTGHHRPRASSTRPSLLALGTPCWSLSFAEDPAGDDVVQVDPILAQGTGVAIEDAYELATQVAAAPSDPAIAFRAYEERTANRAKILSLLSDLSQGLGQMTSQTAIDLRDRLFTLSPSLLKGPFFDAMIRLSLARDWSGAIGSSYGYECPPLPPHKDE